MKQLLAIALLCTGLYACNNASSDAKKADLLAANIDSTVKPGDDFFEYANGFKSSWILTQTTILPPATW